MSIEERIAELLSEHRFERWSVSKDGYFAWWGHCVQCGFESDRRNSSYVGWELDMHDDEARHAASVLVAELGLTEESAVRDAFGGEPKFHSGPNTARYLAAGDALGPGTTAITRYVTAWEAL